MKKLRLHRSPLPKEAITAIAKDTLQSGEFDHVAVEQNERQIGAIMTDGSVYAGPSPDTGKPMYAMPADAPVAMTFNRAAEHAKQLNEQKLLGHNDWRVPTKAELNVLFNNRAALGGFKVSGSYPAAWYWSATPYDRRDAWCQRFSNGKQTYIPKGRHLPVRLIRTDARRVIHRGVHPRVPHRDDASKTELNNGVKP